MPKAFVLLNGQTFLDRILARCAESGSDVTVTVDPAFKQRLMDGLKARSMPRLPLHLRWVEADGRQPMLASIQAALAVGGFDRGFWLWPVDAPFLSAAGWRVLGETVEVDDQRILKPRAEGRSGHPVWFPGWAVLRIARGDWPNGLLGFLAVCTPEQVRAVDLPGEHVNDIDTPEELRALEQSAIIRGGTPAR
jgi:CTP:molybdopterin cytidylyltransferase MocA